MLRDSASPSAPSPFTAASYNIHSCIGSDRRFDPARVASVIGELRADIVALQEVDARERHDGYLDQWVYLAQATGFHCVPGISLRTHRNIYGNALLLRDPPDKVRLHDISVTRREPRGVIDVDLTLAGQAIRVIATHLGLRPKERQEQVGSLLDILRGGSDRPVLLMGDLNEWRPDMPSIARLLAAFQPMPRRRSFPARLPLFPLDRILFGNGFRPIEHWAHRSALSRLASDHLPVCASAELLAKDRSASAAA